MGAWKTKVETPEIQELLDSLLPAVTDPKRRNAGVQVVQEQCLPMIQSHVIDRLVEVVKRGGTDHDAALASLIQFGPPALRVLMRNLDRSATTAVQLRLVEALNGFAGNPSFKGRVDLTLALANMGLRVDVHDSENAFANLLATLRRSSEQQASLVQ